MKIIHTADLHLGQVIYQHYDRYDEHEHFFSQLEKWCAGEKPDALVISGDIFDIQQPSATTKKTFTEHFVRLHSLCPDMHIVIVAGNHDSASRIQADSPVWKLANATLVGLSPSVELTDGPDGWQDDYIVKLDSGFIVTLPYMVGERRELIQSILDRVADMNTEGKPVVMTGHLAVTGSDVTGHGFDIGKIRTQGVCDLGKGYDYLALGHIHKPQTIGHLEDAMNADVTYPSGVVRYSGSALHVSCDEAYPHTVSVVTIGEHGGEVNVRQLRIDELRHFHILPEDGSSFTDADAAVNAVKNFADTVGSGYIRLRFDYAADIPADFNQNMYDTLKPYGEEVRYNPQIIWTGKPEETEGEKPVFQVAELQQMKDPMVFIEKTASQYPGLDLDEVREAFMEVKDEIERYEDEQKAKAADKEAKKAAKKAGMNTAEEESTTNEEQ